MLLPNETSSCGSSVILFSRTQSGNLTVRKKVELFFTLYYQVEFGWRLLGPKLFSHKNNTAKIFFFWARICKRSRKPRHRFVACAGRYVKKSCRTAPQAGNRFLGTLIGLQIWALEEKLMFNSTYNAICVIFWFLCGNRLFCNCTFCFQNETMGFVVFLKILC